MLIEGGIKLSEQLTNSAPMLPERPRNELQITDQKSVSVDDIADEEDDTVEQKIKGVGNGHFSNELNDRSMHSKTNSYGAAPAHVESSQTNQHQRLSIQTPLMAISDEAEDLVDAGPRENNGGVSLRSSAQV